MIQVLACVCLCKLQVPKKVMHSVLRMTAQTPTGYTSYWIALSLS